MTHITPGLIKANGDTQENVFTFANSLAIIANGGAGEDYYLYLSGQVMISDYSSHNRLYFGANITITAADISKSQLHISFQGTEDTLRLRNFSSYRFFLDNGENGLSHTEFLARANSGFTTNNINPLFSSSITASASERTVEIRANGTTDADTFTLGYDLRAEFNGGAGRDTFAITPYQTDDVLIRDFSVGNLIRFESGVEIDNFEIDRGTFEISLVNGAIVSVIIGSLQYYQLEEGTVTDAGGFMVALAPTSITLGNPIATLAEGTNNDAITVATINIVSYRNLVIGGLELSGDDSRLFEVNEAQTELLLKAGSSVDFETNPSLDVTLSSVLNPDISADLTISVTDIAAMITMGQIFTVSETANTNDFVATVVTSGDMNSFQFDITHGGNGVFEINNTGEIKVADSRSLNFETTASYTLTVRVGDGTTETSQTVTISVIDENEAPTISNNIPLQGLAVGGMITIDLADFFSDQDADDSLRYTATSNPANVVTTMIDGSMLTLREVEGNAFVSAAVTVTASDLAGLETMQTFTVQIPVPATALAEIQMNDNDRGFVINGADAGDRSGLWVSGAGDVNGDGLDDIIIGAFQAEPDGITATDDARGVSYLVFGKTAGAIIELSMLGSDQGFIINGVAAGDISGRSVSGAGDVNGDGLDDILIGARDAAPNGNDDSGAGYVVFGKSDGSVVELSTIDNADDSNGFVINGVDMGDRSSFNLSGGGDINGDGLDDIIIGASEAEPNGVATDNRGASYVVFGKSDGAIVELSEIDDANDNNGFVINGAMMGDYSGFPVSVVGDINGDGLDDVLIGAYRAESMSGTGDNHGASFVVFGKSDGAIVELSEIADTDNNDGFVLNGANAGDQSGISVSGAGDVNGDGLDDIIIGAFTADGTGGNNSGASYVVFGKTNGGIVELSTIDNANNNGGFVINGVDIGDASGISVSGAGDINGDGLDDLIIGARAADPNGTESGASYVVFGKRDGSVVELSDIENNNSEGFAINGVSMDDQSGISVSGAGDVNGDGFDDLLVGSSFADPNGNDDSGAGYVIFGGQGVLASTIRGTANAETLTGDGMANQIIGGAGNDTLIANGGADVLRGGAGDDVLVLGNNLSDADFAIINGGLGTDTLRLDSMMTLNLASIPNNRVDSIEIINLNSTDSTLVLATDDILSIVGSSAKNTLQIDGGSTDTLDLTQTAFLDSEETEDIDRTNYRIYQAADSLGLDDSLTLLVAPDISVSVAVVVPTTVLAEIQVSDNDRGFVINGADSGDQSGISVSGVGDVNGDGLDDIIIGATQAEPGNTDDNRGVSYVVFGKTAGAIIELSMLGGDQGFVINGAAAGDFSSLSVSGGGDVNGDGLDDILIGAHRADSNGNNNSGAGYVVFGKTSGAIVELSTIDNADNGNGFVINGVDIDDRGGFNLSGGGDINGDGLDDIIIGAFQAEPAGVATSDNRGASYVVFGKSDGAIVELSDIDETDNNNGFVINGVATGDISGRSVSGAGDVNGDGFDDILIGAYKAELVSDTNDDRGASYVVFGKASGAIVELSDIDNADNNNGFVLNGANEGDQSGIAVSGAGDVNGDGLDDLIIGAFVADSASGNNSGASYVVFGKRNGGIVELSTIADANNNGGFVINGAGEGDTSGFSVSGAGDINGDGLDDLIIGARAADPNGIRSGASYVVFGKRDGSVVELSDIENNNSEGFAINGVSADDLSGYSVSGAGDVNGDGFDDLIVGARDADPNSSSVTDNRGASYVIFGGLGVASTGAQILRGDSGANRLIGGAGDDTLIANGGEDVLRGGGGNDVLAISDDDFAIINGGLGTDTLRLDSMMTLDLTSIPNNRIDSIEVIDLNGTASTLILALDDILNIVGSGAQNTLQIDGGSTDTLYIISAPFSDSGTTRIGGTDYRLYQPADSLGLDDSLSLLVAPDISISVTVVAPAIELSAIHNDGFAINGVTTNDESGRSVSAAGDINGDGLDDLIIGAPSADPNGSLSGASYVVFGKSDGAIVELSEIGGNDGFVINGVTNSDRSGRSVSGAGDVNGDGLDDLIIGAPLANPNQSYSGASYVVFGKSDGSVVELSVIADADANNNDGFVINGVTADDENGFSVSGAGDINGDGLDDLIIGANQADPNGNYSGASYVVFGKSDGAIVELSDIDNPGNNNGFVLNGVSRYDYSGISVSGAGDVNGDGLDDILIGASYASQNGYRSGTSYVVFGKASGDSVELDDIADDDTEEGFALYGGFLPMGATVGENSGGSVSGAGDVNGDGLDDIIIGAFRADPNGMTDSGTSYVVFGKTDGVAVQLSNIADATNNAGFVLNGVNGAEGFERGDYSGTSVSGAGDINGDGFDDLIVGASGAGPNGNDSGASYLVFGKSDGNAVELSFIEAFGISGFVINGMEAGDLSGFSVSGAGDVNGDGFDDLLVGAFGADPNSDASGVSYVIFGGQGVLDSAIVGTAGAETLTGNSMANQIIGGAGNDTLIGNGGEDVLRGGAGDDVLALANGTISNSDSVSIDGGLGNDTLRFDAPINLDLSILGRSKIRSIETIDLANDNGASSLSLGLSDVLAISGQTTLENPLTILGDSGDTVNLSGAPTNGIAGSWADADNDNTYSYTATASSDILANIFIDSDITVSII